MAHAATYVSAETIISILKLPIAIFQLTVEYFIRYDVAVTLSNFRLFLNCKFFQI